MIVSLLYSLKWSRSTIRSPSEPRW
jgi:hypothetical protein